MINIGPAELLAICAIALIVLGPDKLPQALRTLGRVMAELRRISTGFQEDIRHAIDDTLQDEEDTRPKGRARSVSGAEDSEREDSLSTSLDTLDEPSDVDEAHEADELDDAEVDDSDGPAAGSRDLEEPAKRNGASGATGS